MQIVRVPHDDRIVPAHFQRQYLVRARCKLAVEGYACLRGAGEQQPVQSCMTRKGLSGVGPTLDDIDDPVRNPGLAKIVDQHRADRRCFLARFEDYRIASNQGRNDMPVGQMRRKIIGTKHREHAMRFVANGVARSGLAVKAALRGAVGIGFDRDVDLVDDGFDLVARFP